MMTLHEAHAKLDQWYEDGCVGNIWFFRAPRAKMVDGFVEHTVKMREMNELETEVVNNMHAVMGGLRLELFTGADGKPDRIKSTRSL